MKNSNNSQQKSLQEQKEYLASISPKLQEQVKHAEELLTRPLSEKHIEYRINEMFAVHGQRNPNRK